ncbi:Adenylate cyclase [Zhongshania aliphaticivorans]|uniref:Adenylate cyclase n=1 Tax=Zhongshania aliphaticivorans TaxID=1470434 RepID=A0A5S9PGS8_9GAMM|nr:class I adenylate cyclase [Zhongshania aliphaticivorans]CAA0102947.1 Adenylate cyclase [Zhongshania aliphaticivorans]CAA0113815.1 Adenylate cyclase [Zhongshania aliphaticivorans]
MADTPLNKEAHNPLFDRGMTHDGLALIRDRFLTLNRERLIRTRTALLPRQQIFLDLLPLLIHINHPILPGYNSLSVPCGIDGYQPDTLTLNRVRQNIARSLDYQPEEQAPPQIHSVFLMGSCGTVAQAENSDLDVWLCHNANIDEADLKMLYHKAGAISEWAKGLGLDIHFFLMNNDQFRRGQRDDLSAESAGTSQHFLLLDEFYRSALLVAGRYPIWWLVPPEEEVNYQEYTALLHAQGFVGPNESIDFGGVSDIPAGEFIGAGVWQLYKAISSPYKAVLKLLLTEAYARDFPKVLPLSVSLKQAIYHGNTNPDTLDPYVMVYHRLAEYLNERQEFDRLELIRRAFYFKVGIRLSQLSNSNPTWRQQLLQTLIKQWQWQPEQLLNMDTRSRWKLRRVREEHRFLVAELTNSYRFLQDFAQRSKRPALIKSQEMTLLGRKLYAAFERKPYKIECLNPGIAPDLTEEQLFFHASGFGSQRRWAVSTSARHDFETDAILQEHDHLSGLLCWCFCNGLINEYTRLRLNGRQDGVTETDLRRLAKHLSQYLPRHPYAANPDKHEAFNRPKVPETLIFYINLGQYAQNALGAAGLSSQNTNYPINQIEMIGINSWGEVSSIAFNGPDTLLSAFRTYQQLMVAASRASLPPTIHALYFNDPDDKLRNRTRHLPRLLFRAFYTKPANNRLLIKLSSGFHILQTQNDELQSIHAKNYPTFIQCLGRGQTEYSPIIMDRYCAPNTALASIIRIAKKPDCYVFFHIRGKSADIFVRDERGSLHFSTTAFTTTEALIVPLLAFLYECQKEQQSNHQLHVFELHQKNDKWQGEARPEFTEANRGSQYPAPVTGLELEAIAQNQETGRLVFDMRCNDQLFRYAQAGQELFNELAEQLQLLSDKPEYYRLNKINLSIMPPQQTCVYMRYKQHIEEILNTSVLAC